MTKNLKTILAILTISLFPFLVGMVSLWVNGKMASPKWESLGSPPETPVRFIAGYVGDAGHLVNDAEGNKIYMGRETKVYIETVASNIYECCSRAKSSLVWNKIEKDKVKEVNWAESCLKNGKDENKKHIEDEIDNYAIYWCGENDVGRAYYGLSKDGTIWIWKQDTRWIDPVILFCKSFSVGIFLIIASAVILEVRRKLSQK
jgi:hypothetical protein